MALTTLDDIKRVMGNPKRVSDDQLAKYLETAESYLRTRLPAYDDPDGGTASYFNVSASDRIQLPVPDATVAAVRVFDFMASAARPLITATDYWVEDGWLQLSRYGGGGWPIRDERPGKERWYAKVEVDWMHVESVPPAVRDAVALTAAALYEQFPKLFSGVRSERIGDYSYVLEQKDVEQVVPPKAAKLLKPFMHKRRVFVT